MASVTFVYFNRFHLDRWKKLHDCDGETMKVALVDSTLAPTATTADPRWGAGGSTDLSVNEVATGSTYSAGGSDTGNAVSIVGAKVTFDLATNIKWLKDATGFTDARYLIVYNNDDAGKRAIGFADLGSDISLQSEDFDITWHGSGLSDEDDKP